MYLPPFPPLPPRSPWLGRKSQFFSIGCSIALGSSTKVISSIWHESANAGFKITRLPLNYRIRPVAVAGRIAGVGGGIPAKADPGCRNGEWAGSHPPQGGISNSDSLSRKGYHVNYGFSGETQLSTVGDIGVAFCLRPEIVCSIGRQSRDTSDRRIVHVILTDKGRDILCRAVPKAMVLIRQVMSSITEGDTMLLREKLSVLKQNADNGLRNLVKPLKPSVVDEANV